MCEPDYEQLMSEMIQTRHILEWYEQHYSDHYGGLQSNSLILTDPLGHLKMLYRDATDRGLPFPPIEELRAIQAEDNRYHLALNRASEVGDIWRYTASRDAAPDYWRVEAIYSTPDELPVGGMFYVQEDMPMLRLVQILGDNEGQETQPKEQNLKAHPGWTRWPHEYLHKLPRNVNGLTFGNPYEGEE
jgi:hypothetical protein